MHKPDQHMLALYEVEAKVEELAHVFGVPEMPMTLRIMAIIETISQVVTDLNDLKTQAQSLALRYDETTKEIAAFHVALADIVSPPSPELDESALVDIRRELDLGNKINAIKICRTATCMSLREAKALIDSLPIGHSRANSAARSLKE